jgi:O-succinylhomoserine sulfhydrylase
MRPETLAIRTQTERTAQKEHATPLFLTSSFVYDSAEDMAAAFADDSLDVNIYSRFSNPSVDEFIQKVCLLEGAEDGIATATGMAAVSACFMTFLSAGDHIISASAVFGSTHTILTKYLPKWGIEYSYFDMNTPEVIESLIKPKTKVLYVETPSNPGLDIIDLEYVSALCKKHNSIFIVDNCFATPAVQQPIQFGADLVLHSATKFMDGQGRVLGGVVVGKKDFLCQGCNGSDRCPDNEKDPSQLDRAVLETYKVKPGKVYTVYAAVKKVIDYQNKKSSASRLT